MKFEPEDFNLCKDELSQERMTQRAAHLANAKLQQILNEAPDVFLGPDANPSLSWGKRDGHTHKGKVVEITELGK